MQSLVVFFIVAVATFFIICIALLFAVWYLAFNAWCQVFRLFRFLKPKK